MVEFVLGILGKVGEYLVDPTLRQFKYMCCLNSNITELETQLKKMEPTRQEVQMGVNEARTNARVPGPAVLAWLSDANELTTEVEQIIQDKAKVKEGCLNGWCPNLKLRYSLSRKAVKKTKSIMELKADGVPYIQSSHSPPPACLGTIPNADFIGFESRKLKEEEIIDALKHDEINLIGICGMGGAGKTTMAKEVAKRVKEVGLFDEVAFAVVGKLETNPGQEPDLTNVQACIADMLGLRNFREKESPITKADLLRERLLQDNKRILVILDDIWAEFNLKATGFPLEGTNFKMLYTSRTRDLWPDLRTRKKEIPLGLLSEDEAWQLFREKAGDLADAWDFRPIAKKIVDECGCLPLALVLIGCALSKRGGINAKDLWQSMLDQLTRSRSTTVDEHLYSRLKLSYEYLEDEEAQNLFLLCCLFEEDEAIRIENLARYAFGLSLFDGMTQIGEVRRRVLFIVDDLKSRYLLLDSEIEKEKRVKVHDVVRDMGIAIASKGKFALVRHGEVSQLPKTDINEHYTAMSVISEKIIELPTGSTNPDLKFLMLRCKQLKKIPPNFFEAMENLKVLELNGFCGNLTLQSLRNLTTLSIHDSWCTLGNVSLNADLLNLEILSIEVSKIIPKEIGRLVNLKLLDLSSPWDSMRIPPGVISSLIHLEELYVWDNSSIWEEGEEEGKGEGRKANLRELELLPNLHTLEICISENVLIPEAPIFSKLTTYKVFIGEGFDYVVSDFINNCKRVLGVKSSIPIPSNRGGIDSLLRSSDCLVLSGEGCNDLVQDICCRPVPVTLFQGKTYIRLKNCGRVEQVIWKERQEDINGATNRIEFPKLEALKLGKLPNLVGFCRGIDHIDFSQLKTLRLKDIPKLNLLFHNNSNLSSNSEQNDNVNLLSFFPQKVSLPSLEVLEVAKLQSLVRLGDVQHSVGSLSKLKDVSMRECSKLLSVLSSQWISMLQELQSLKVESCDSLEVVFEWEGLESEEPNPEILSAAKYVRLKNLPKLNCISKRGFVGYKYIETLEIEDCNSLRCVFEPTMTKSVLQLRKLKISNCQMLSTIVAGENGLGESSVNEVEFPHLKELDLQRLPSLVSLFNAKVSLPSLEVLEVAKLQSLVRLGDVQHSVGSLSKLKDVSMCECSKLLSVFPSQWISMLRQLQRLRVESCDSLEVVFEWEGFESQEPYSEILSAPKYVELKNLPKLKCISKRGFVGYKYIETLEIKDCNSLRCVFEPTMTNSVPQLRKLKISKCQMLSTIVAGENGLGESFVNEVEFPQLKELELSCLPSLVSFFPNANVYGTTLAKSTDHHHLFNAKVSLRSLEVLIVDELPNLERLVDIPLSVGSLSKLKDISVCGCDKLLSVFPSQLIPMLPELQTLTVENCDSLEVLIEWEGLDNLERLVDIPLSVGSLSKLKDVSVCSCGKLLSVFPSQLIPMLQELQTLTVRGCNSLEVLIEWEGLDNLERLVDIPLSVGSLSKLKDILVCGCDKLLSVFPSQLIPMLPELQTLTVRGCNSLEVLIEWEGLDSLRCVFELRRLDISCCEKLSTIVASENGLSESYMGEVEFPQLEEVDLKFLPSLVSFFPNANANVNSTTLAKSTDHHHNPLLPQPLFNEKDTITSFEYLVPVRLQSMSSSSFSKLKYFRAKDCANLRNIPFISFFGDLDSTKESLQEVTRLLYTNYDGVLALGSDGIITQWIGRWNFSPSGKTIPQWRGLASGLAVMKNDVTGVNLKEAVPCMALSENYDRYIYSACGGRVSVFDLVSCRVKKTLSSSPPPASTYLALCAGGIIAIGMEDSTILVHSTYRDDQVKSKLESHKKRITGLSFSTKLGILVSSGADAQLCTWSTGSWTYYNSEWKSEKLKSVPLQLPTGVVRESDTRVQFHSDGIHLLVSHESQLAIYDASEMDCVRQWVPHDALPAPISSAVYSCDSQLVYTTFCDANIGVFDADSLMLRYRIVPSMYLDPKLLSRYQDLYPTAVAAHPKKPNQFAIGLTQGSVIIMEPPESEGQWGLSPTVDNVMLNETTASSSTMTNTSNDAPDQKRKKEEEEKGKGILYG